MPHRTLRRAAALALPIAVAACGDRDPLAPAAAPHLALADAGYVLLPGAHAESNDHAAWDIANTGRIVGSGGVLPEQDPAFPIGGNRGLTWANAASLPTILRHPTPAPAAPYAEALGISDNGEWIVGSAARDDGTRGPIVWNGSSAFVIPSAGGPNGDVTGVNNAGTVVANLRLDRDTWETAGFRYQGGVLYRLPTLCAGQVLAQGINNAGVIAGRALDAECNYRPAKWIEGELSFLSVDDGYIDAIPNAINDAGTVAGWAYTNDGQDVPYAWIGGVGRGLQVLGAETGFQHGGVTDINTAGLMVGHTTRGGYMTMTVHAVWWEANGVIHELPVPPGAIYSYATGINDAGAIVGYTFAYTEAKGYHYQALAWNIGAVAPPNRDPVAVVGGGAPIVEGSVGSFSGTGSSDPDGDALAFAWDLDNDGDFDDATGATASRTFADNGTFTVRLRVTDDRGASSIASRTIAVSNSAPQVTRVYLPFPALNTPKVGQAWTLEAVFTDRNPNDGPFAVSANWGDGTMPLVGTVATAGGIGGTHVFTSPGARTVTIRIVDKDGGVATKTVPVNVQP